MNPTPASIPPAPHLPVNPASLARPIGYAHGVLATKGRLLFLGGQVGWDKDGRFPYPHDLVKQAEHAMECLVAVLKEAGGKPEHVTQLRVYVLSAKAWREHSKAIGEAWRRHFGRWYPAMALFEVKALYEPDSLVELEGMAVIPDPA